MDLIPILLGSLPLAHNALVIGACNLRDRLLGELERPARPPSRTTGPRCLYNIIYIYIYMYLFFWSFFIIRTAHTDHIIILQTARAHKRFRKY